jgi:hypothetical protein
MAFRVVPHPRASNKPLECQMGLHGKTRGWDTAIIGGVPVLVCKDCGSCVFKDVLNHTMKKREEKKLLRPYLDYQEQRRALLRESVLAVLERQGNSDKIREAQGES